jgi:hypothetical protein
LSDGNDRWLSVQVHNSNPSTASRTRNQFRRPCNNFCSSSSYRSPSLTQLAAAFKTTNFHTNRSHYFTPNNISCS